MTALNNRTHIFARPNTKERLIWCFGTLLGCGEPAAFNAPGASEPILAFRFPHGGSLSVEFTDDAPDDEQARRGAWLEIATADAVNLQRAVRDAGLPQVHYSATNRFYFQAPGGQVFGIVPANTEST